MLLATGLSQKSPAAFITGSSTSLLDVFTSEFGMLVVNGEARAVGKLESYQEALALMQYFQARGVTRIIASQKISADFPDLNYRPGFSTIAGLLAIPLSSSERDFLVVFRKEQLMEIHWAGNTKERFQLIGGANTEPNASFQRWVEHVVDTSREWTSWQCKYLTCRYIFRLITDHSGNCGCFPDLVQHIHGLLAQKTSEHGEKSKETASDSQLVT